MTLVTVEISRCPIWLHQSLLPLQALHRWLLRLRVLGILHLLEMVIRPTKKRSERQAPSLIQVARGCWYTRATDPSENSDFARIAASP